MAIDKFPFTTDAFGISRPYLAIRIHNPHTGKSVLSYGLVDTGADDCAIPAEYARILGHDLLKGQSRKINTGNGETNAYQHTTQFDILHPRSSNILYKTNNVPIDYLPNLSVVLIGVRSFLSEFILTIDYPNKLFSIKK